MNSLILLFAVGPAAYKFEPTVKHEFKMSAIFEGFLPILGGNEGKVEVKMGVDVQGLTPIEGQLRAANEINSFDIKFNGAPLPLGLETVQDFFPRTTIQMDATGKIKKTDAKDKTLPVRLPGLDAKRFPDLVYVPLELPKDGLSLGLKWNFEKDFGGDKLAYKCEVKRLDEASVDVEVKVSQTYELLETESLEVVKEEKDAVSRVKTTMTGGGTVRFNLAMGVPDEINMKNVAKSEVFALKGSDKSTRELTTTFLVRREGYKPAAAISVAKRGLWENVSSWAAGAWESAGGYLALMRTAIAMALANIPGASELASKLRLVGG